MCCLVSAAIAHPRTSGQDQYAPKRVEFFDQILPVLVTYFATGPFLYSEADLCWLFDLFSPLDASDVGETREATGLNSSLVAGGARHSIFMTDAGNIYTCGFGGNGARTTPHPCYSPLLPPDFTGCS